MVWTWHSRSKSASPSVNRPACGVEAADVGAIGLHALERVGEVLRIGSDLDPVWSLVSDRARAQGQSRNLTWGDRIRLSPTRIGALADQNLA